MLPTSQFMSSRECHSKEVVFADEESFAEGWATHRAVTLVARCKGFLSLLHEQRLPLVFTARNDRLSAGWLGEHVSKTNIGRPNDTD